MAEADDRQQSRVDQAMNLAQTGRFFVFTIQKFGTAARGAGALVAIGGWPVVVAIASVLGFTLFFLTLGGQNLTGQTPVTEAGTFVPAVAQTRPEKDTYQALSNDLEKNFPVQFVGFDPNFHYNYLLWSWQKLSNANNTQFLSLVRGSRDSGDRIVVKRVDGPFSLFAGCLPSTVNMSGISSATGAPYPEHLYKVVFMHELSHAIDRCSSSRSRKNELQQIIDREGYLTAYSQSSFDCSITKTDNLSEDYAEMISYFLNPEWNEVDFGYWQRDPKCLPPRTTENPYKTGRFPLHQKLAAEILGISLSPTPTLITSAAKLSCPVAGGTITYPSFQANGVTGHCGKNYVDRAKELGYDESQYACNTGSRRAKSVDVLTDGGPNGKEVRLPFIDEKRLNWTRIEGVLQLSRTDCFPEEMLPSFNCGVGIAFTAKDEMGNSWVLQLLHMYEPSLAIEVGQSYPSGTVVGRSEAIHTHVTIGKNVAGNQAFAVAGSSDTRSGWLAPDLEMGMCQ